MCELTYIRCGDYFIPNITVPEEPGTLNKYGRMRRPYLKEHLPLLYQNMLLTGTLHKHLVEISEQAEERLETMMPLLMEQNGINEALKARDPMAWVGAMNNLHTCAEEIILAELVYV